MSGVPEMEWYQRATSTEREGGTVEDLAPGGLDLIACDGRRRAFATRDEAGDDRDDRRPLPRMRGTIPFGRHATGGHAAFRGHPDSTAFDRALSSHARGVLGDRRGGALD
jgi:hypothetical protein